MTGECRRKIKIPIPSPSPFHVRSCGMKKRRSAHAHTDVQRLRWNTVYICIWYTLYVCTYINYIRGRRRQTTDDKTPCICQRQNQKETFKNEPSSPTTTRSLLLSMFRDRHLVLFVHIVPIHTHTHTGLSLEGRDDRGGRKGMMGAERVKESRGGAAAHAAADSEQEKYENEKNRHCQTTAAAVRGESRPRERRRSLFF